MATSNGYVPWDDIKLGSNKPTSDYISCDKLKGDETEQVLLQSFCLLIMPV